jgi:carbamoyltransferase
MIILGINGWMERSHDAAACLIIDNQIVAMAEEERFIRQKNSFDKLPLNAVAYCLQEGKIGPDEIDVISWGWDYPLVYRLHGRKFLYDSKVLNELLFPQKYYPRKERIIPVEFIPHHLAHAASAYCAREDDKPLPIVVVDGESEDCSVSIFLGSKGKIKKIREYPIQVSPGFFYEAGCKYLGFKSWQAGKLMGLACYGEPAHVNFFKLAGEGKVVAPLSNLKLATNSILDWEEEVVGRWMEIFEKKWGGKKNPSCSFSTSTGSFKSVLELGVKEKNIAASIQSELEKVYGWYASEAVRITGHRNIALAGGVALNCSANGMLLDHGIVDSICIQPAANDSGAAIGAAVLMLDEIAPGLLRTPYLGPQFSRDEMFSLLGKVKASFTEPEDIYLESAKALENGKVVGWFGGRMEFGPRALGGRSILADPRRREMHSTVNNIKAREMWRPLAPSVLEEGAGKFFSSGRKSPYMLIRDYVKAEKASQIPAVVHVDHSSRLQTVSKGFNPRYYKLLDSFRLLTGIPILLNTSFNDEKEPIVCSPLDALKTFYGTGMDLLVLGPFLVKK